IELDIISYPHEGGMEKVNLESSGDTTKEDEENPPEKSHPSSTSNNNRSIAKYISSYFMRYIRQ
ncbi:hypothetical protein MKW94_007804, partial [Papaver nudicaule]|nr:hypothetical protein [Papaver nudicaule]